jgi:hypothetical protein
MVKPLHSFGVRPFPTALHSTLLSKSEPGDLTVKSFEPRMVCTKCGTIGADVRPNWKEMPR